MTGGNNKALISDSSSPMNGIGKAPVKRRAPTNKKPDSLSASQSSNWDSEEHKREICRKMGKFSSSSSFDKSEVSENIMHRLFSNP